MDEKNLQHTGAEEEIPQKPKFELNIDEQAFEEFGEQTVQQEPVKEPDQPERKKKKKEKKKNKKPKKKRTVWGIIARIIVTLAILGLCAGLSLFSINAIGDLFGLKNDTETKEVHIEPNSSVLEIAQQLKEEDIINYPRLFYAYVKYRRPDAVFKFGKFELSPAMAYDELVAELQKSAESDSVAKVTLPEGKNVFEYAQILEDAGVCGKEDFLAALNQDYPDYDFLPAADQVSPQRVYRLEGYLFPDTYEFYLDEDPTQVVKTFLDNFSSKFTDEMKSRTQELGMTVDQIVTLASIVQGEAPVGEEMEKVASVYWNRLNNPQEYPKLESDPTGRYAKRYLEPNGSAQEVLDAYNTYVCQGLPAGPINNPGVDALTATLYPADTDYYFFCSNLDTKEFYYASTYEEHQQNLQTAGLTE
ncbi:MAG: endolytic transglycosylase MltG [Massiliimalia sp.]